MPTPNRPYQGYPYVDPPVHDISAAPPKPRPKRRPNLGYPVEPPVHDTDTVRRGRYQGYLSRDRTVTDAPTIDEATAARWNNLPRKPAELPVRKPDPVVYVSMPDEEPNPSAHRQYSKRDPAEDPVVYIDLPDADGHQSDVSRTPDNEEAEFEKHKKSRLDLAEEPVVYIDMPGANGSQSDVAQSPDNDEPEFVQETIFFDPFENRRIEMSKENESDQDTVSTVSGHSSRPRALPPVRPNNLDLYGAASSSAGASSSNISSTPGLPTLMSKETMLYGTDNDDGFPVSPIPISEFPEPPPAYTEIDSRVNSPAAAVEPAESEPAVKLPRTQVILPRDHATTPVGLPSSDRKYLNCHHCGESVHTLVVKENGTITHAMGFMFLLLCLFPITIWIYCTDILKVKNHYCPNCNKIIGQETPLCGKDIEYVQ